MNIARSYRYAAFLPLVLTLAGGAFALVIPDRTPHLVLGWIRDTGEAFAFTGLYALVPYALFMAVVWFFFRPEGDTAHRRMAVLAPLYIAACLDVIYAVLATLSPFHGGAGRWRSEVSGVLGLNFVILAIGYLHAGIVIATVEGIAFFERRRSRRAHGDDFVSIAS